MSELTAKVSQTPTGLRVQGYEQLDYQFHYINSVFDTSHAKLADIYEKWGRVLIIIDDSELVGTGRPHRKLSIDARYGRVVVAPIYRGQIEAYFSHYKLPINWKIIKGGEINKNM